MAAEVGQPERKPFKRKTLHRDDPLLKPHVDGGSGYYVRDRLFPKSADSVRARILTTPEGPFIQRHDDPDLYDNLADWEYALYDEEIKAQEVYLSVHEGG